jgi:hypothetical protein
MRMRRSAAAAALLSVVALAGAVALVSGLIERESPEEEPTPGAAPPPVSAAPASPAESEAPEGPGPAPTGGAVVPTPPGASPATRWRPRAGLAWQWQLTQPVDQSVNVPVYDIDGFDNSAAVVKALHAKKRKVICYVEVGSAENFRPDFRQFPAAVLGKDNGWEGEHWTDIRRMDVLEPIIAKRFDMCKAKGFYAIEPDLMDNFANDTGFPLTAADQVKFNKRIADLVHARGLAAGLKNDAEQVPQLQRFFDFAVVESCAEWKECAEYSPFIKADKPVFHAEYQLEPAEYCAETRKLRLSSIHKNLRLDAPRKAC